MDLVELDFPLQRLPDTLLEGWSYFILNVYKEAHFMDHFNNDQTSHFIITFSETLIQIAKSRYNRHIGLDCAKYIFIAKGHK